eukprot:7297-Heterococcus_DN1.PRE.4
MAPKRKATPAKAKKPASKAPSPAAARSSAEPTPRKGKAAPAAGKRRKVDTRAAQPGAELTDSEEDEAPRLLSSFPDMGDSDSEEDEAAAASGGAAFSDANKDWLKPARTAGEDSEDDSSSDDGAGDDFAADGDDDEMDIERLSRLLDAQMAEEAEEAVEEVKEALARDVAEARQSLKLPRLATAPTATTAAAGAEGSAELEDELEEEGGLPPPAVLKERITDVVEVLSDFKTRRDPDLSRAEYMEQLARDMAEYYGYLRELIDLFLRMFSPAECVEFLEASERPRPVVIRTNTLKTRRKDLAEVSSQSVILYARALANDESYYYYICLLTASQALIKRGVSLEPVAAWSKVGLKVTESSVPIGATPEYLAGHYMLQSAASMCPVMALDPQPNERVLDMSAAPGGKTSYICQLMRNTGAVVANDLKAARQKATVGNLHRLGARNALVCCHDGRAMPGMMGGFDRVLLDAPCSGLGVISRDPSVKVQRSLKDIQRTAHLQKELLAAAIDCLSAASTTGGIAVYSTCSVSVEENEQRKHCYAPLSLQYAMLDMCVKYNV